MKRRGHLYRDVSSGIVLDAWFPRSNNPAKRSCFASKCGLIESENIEVSIDDFAEPPRSVEEVYLRLHLLSECECPPNSLNLDGIFGLLTCVAWTSAGPVLPQQLDELRARVSKDEQQLIIYSIDKFPRMVDYVIPPGVVVGEGSDAGAGSLVMGTLSGGGKQANAIGKNSLLGANAGIGISLGDRCLVEAGRYDTAGSLVSIAGGDVVKARERSGQSDLLFRRNGRTGCIKAVSSNGVSWGGLNQNLHAKH